jgi:hypothetical protein
MLFVPPERPHQFNPTSGRPEEPTSWRIEKFYIACLRFMSAVFGLGLPVPALLQHQYAIAPLSVAVGIWMWIESILRIRSLRRRKIDLAQAEQAYIAAVLDFRDGS